MEFNDGVPSRNAIDRQRETQYYADRKVCTRGRGTSNASGGLDKKTRKKQL
jgi:hypothetical protein